MKRDVWLQNLKPNERLGAQGHDDIRNHPFLKGFDWSRLRKMPAPKLHKVQNKCTVMYFFTLGLVLYFYISSMPYQDSECG